MDNDAKEIRTINTSKGLFKMCRLPQGLKQFFIHLKELHRVNSQRNQVFGYPSRW